MVPLGDGKRGCWWSFVYTPEWGDKLWMKRVVQRRHVEMCLSDDRWLAQSIFVPFPDKSLVPIYTPGWIELLSESKLKRRVLQTKPI